MYRAGAQGTMDKSFCDLLNGVVLAELGGFGDGPYCAKHGAGAALVMLGTYIVDEGDSVPYPSHFVFKPGRPNYLSYLQKHVTAARAGGARVGVSAISVEMQHTVEFLATAQEAGADYASLCAHSNMEMFAKQGLGLALCHPANRGRLNEWAGAIAGALSIPVIFKIGFASKAETSDAIETIAHAGVPIVHVNIGGSDSQSEGLQALGQLAGKCQLLIAGGGIADAESARRVLQAGAGAVAIGSAAMKDPTLCGRVHSQLQNR